MSSGEAGLVFLLVTLVLYCLPTVIAYFRNHRNAGAIFLLNLLLGWTLLGWVLALCMAVWVEKQDLEVK